MYVKCCISVYTEFNLVAYLDGLCCMLLEYVIGVLFLKKQCRILMSRYCFVTSFMRKVGFLLNISLFSPDILNISCVHCTKIIEFLIISFIV